MRRIKRLLNQHVTGTVYRVNQYSRWDYTYWHCKADALDFANFKRYADGGEWDIVRMNRSGHSTRLIRIGGLR